MADVQRKVGGRSPPTLRGRGTPNMVQNGTNLTIKIPDSQLKLCISYSSLGVQIRFSNLSLLIRFFLARNHNLFRNDRDDLVWFGALCQCRGAAEILILVYLRWFRFRGPRCAWNMHATAHLMLSPFLLVWQAYVMRIRASVTVPITLNY